MKEKIESIQNAVREELRFWPYTIHQIDDTLDSSLIEGRAKQILFQALNSHMLTAFVGSGVSMAYGRMAWTEFQQVQTEIVSDVARTFVDLVDASLKQLEAIEKLLEPGSGAIPWPPEDDLDDPNGTMEAKARQVWRWVRQRQQVIRQARSEVVYLRNTFSSATSNQGRVPGGEELPVKFEIAKRLHDLLLRHRGLFLWKHGEQRGNDHFELEKTFGSRLDEAEGAPIAEIKSIRKKFEEETSLKSRWTNGLPSDESGNSIIEKKFDDYAFYAQRREANVSFEKYAKILLVDECAHAERLLTSGLECGGETGRHKEDTFDEELEKIRKDLDVLSGTNLRRNVAGIRQNPERFKILSIFTLEKAKRLVGEVQNLAPKGWGHFLVTLEELWEKYDQEDQSASLDVSRTYITPTSRFLTSLLLQLVEAPLDLVTNGGTFDPPETDSFKSRRSVIANRLDPLDKIVGRLKIARFLTTNYDFEIERYFQDQGFRRFDTDLATPSEAIRTGPDDPRSFRTDGMGAIMNDLSFDPDTAADLMSFAAGSDGADASIFHLHGRATDSEKIVVTERDYLDMYLRTDPNREIVDESILAAFAATPILFLGLGLNEADLLKPLRQFISNHDRAIGYKAIALLAGRQGHSARAKEAAGLYMRYGVHTIYFGGGCVRLPEPGANGKPEYQPLDWLHRVVSLIDALREAVNTRADELEKQRKEDSSLKDLESKIDDKEELRACLTNKEELLEAVGTLGPDLAVKSGDEQKCALPYLLGITRQEFDEAEITGEEPVFIVRNCQFTTRRHGSGEESSDYRDLYLDVEPYTSFYITILTELLHICLIEQVVETVGQLQVSLRALRTALDGVDNAVMTASFNAALVGLEQEWRGWWHDWQEPPPYREARFEEIFEPEKQPENEDEFRDEVIIPRRLVRHRVISVITDLQSAVHKTAPAVQLCHERLRAQPEAFCTGVRVFDTFVYDAAAVATERQEASGRLMHTVAAPRGRGKGVFFSTFATRLGLSSYLRAAHPTATTEPGTSPKPCLFSAMFINLSFASEIASVFEMLETELFTTIAKLRTFAEPEAAVVKSLAGAPLNRQVDRQVAFEVCLGSRSTKNHPEYEKLAREVDSQVKGLANNLQQETRSLRRTQRFRSLMKHFHDSAAAFSITNCFGLRFKPRLLICINAIELLFNRNGLPKNREVAAYLKFLASNEASKIPFDLICIGDYSAIGGSWRAYEPMKRATLVASNCAEKVRHAIADQARALSLPTADSVIGWKPEETNFFHCARPIQPREFMVDNFLSLALALYLRRMKARKERDETWNDTLENRIWEFDDKVRERHKKLIRERTYRWHEEQTPEVNELYLGTQQEFEEDLAEKACEHSIFNATCGKGGYRAEVKGLLHKDFEASLSADPDGQKRDEQDWSNLSRVLKGNRFCLTILMAAAQHLVFTKRSVLEGGEAANTMLRNVVTGIRNTSATLVEDAVLEAVMEVYRQTTKVGDPERDHELHRLLIRHIGVLGCPVSPNVLVRLHDIRDYFNKVRMEGWISRRRMVARALAVLSERGLVFRLSPHPKLLRLGRQLGEMRDANRKIVELGFKAMNKKGLILQKGADEKLVDLKRRLADPKGPDSNKLASWLKLKPADRPKAVSEELLAIELSKSDKKPLKHADDVFREWPAEREFRYALHRQVQAYCFQRLGHLTSSPVSANTFAPSLYASLPSRVVRLSREGYHFLRRLLLGLSQYPDIRQEDAARDRPIFKTDKIITQVQALRAAMSLVRTSFSLASVSRFSDENTGLPFSRKRGYFETYKVRLRWIIRKAWEIHEPREGSDRNKYRVNALYRDEVVWLYNEVAVTCLAQGHLIDGIAHARQALFLNQEIERDTIGGYMHNMLSINLACMQLERGRLAGTQRRLSNILETEANQKKSLYRIAEGYLGVVAHLRGRRDKAKTLLSSAIEHLRPSEEDRALAIFLNHKAHVIAPEDPSSAQRLLIEARGFAEAGGHEDVRNRILISEAQISHFHLDENWRRARVDRETLSEIERYARMMGLDSMLVDTLHVQGRMLLHSGDDGGAGDKFTRAIAIARRNQMNLRLNSIMTSHARVLGARGRSASAKRLLESSLMMAKRLEFNLEVVRVHKAMQEIETFETSDFADR